VKASDKLALGWKDLAKMMETVEVASREAKIMRWSQTGNPVVLERAVAGICYLTIGLVGLLYIILSRSSSQSTFFRFHFLQSIILGIIWFLLSQSANILVNILSGMLGLLHNEQVALSVLVPVSMVLQAITVLVMLALLYGAIWAFLGKQAEIPFISKLVRQQMR
jgi:uncharacterized membrane protein